MDSNIINVTGLWIQTDSNGNDYLSGNWGGLKVLIFKNKEKEPGSKQPDYRMCFSETYKNNKESEKK